jgi:hypothetical protein
MRSIEIFGMQQFSKEQILMVYEAALKLRLALENDSDPIAKEFLGGELGDILNSVIENKASLPIKAIPHFSKMTRDYLAGIEDEYFNFYSLATYGKPSNE